MHIPVLPSIGRPKIFRDIGSDSAYTGALAASRETTIKTLVKHTIAKAIVGEWLDFLYDILPNGVPPLVLLAALGSLPVFKSLRPNRAPVLARAVRLRVRLRE